MKNFEFLEHTADAKFRAYGKTLEQAFSNAAIAMSSIIYPPKKVKPKIKKEINISGSDYYSLLYNFLEELLFLLDSEEFILSKIENLKIKDNNLSAVLFGDKASNYNVEGYVKAVTYNEMKIKKTKDKFIVQVVVDL